MSALPRMLTLKEAADTLRVHANTIRNRIRTGDIKHATRIVKRGGSQLLIPEPAIISLCGTARWLK